MKLKKHISILIALLVLVSNSGLAFTVHYCEGKIASISSIFSKEEQCKMPVLEEESCCAKPEVTHKACCSDKKINLKSKTEKIIKTISLDFESAFFSEYKNQTLALVEAQFFSKVRTTFYCESNAPPRYKLYCQFTFYA